MPTTIYDRVQETTNSSGTGSIILNGPVSGFLSFASTVGVNNTTYYGIIDNIANVWEIGIGTLTSSNILSRDTVISSSNSGSLINFVGNPVSVFIDVPASKRVQIDSPIIGTSDTVFYGDASNLTGLPQGPTGSQGYQGVPGTQGPQGDSGGGGSPTLQTVTDTGASTTDLITLSQGFQTASDPQNVVMNSNGHEIIQTDPSGNISIFTVVGTEVFFIDGNSNPQIAAGAAPGFEAPFFGFDSGNNPRVVNLIGQNIISVDPGTNRLMLQGDIYPSAGTGVLSKDDSGNLSWAVPYRTVNAQTGTSYTLSLGDQMVTLNNASSITVTVPASTFPVLTEIDLVQLGTGQVTILEAEGVTINSYVNNLNIAGQYAGATLKQIATDVWLLIGNLA